MSSAYERYFFDNVADAACRAARSCIANEGRFLSREVSHEIRT